MSSNSRCAALVLLGLSTSFACPSISRAQERAEEAATASARALEAGREGVSRYESGRWQEALELFRQAEASYHSPVFVLYEARSLRSLNRFLEARAAYAYLVAETLHESAPELWKQAQGDGRAELAALEAQIPSVVVAVSGGSASTRITLDGRSVTAGASIALDPGEHVAEATDERRHVTRKFTAVAGQRGARIVLNFSAGPYVPGLILAATGALTLIAGGVVGSVALKKSHDAEDALPASCDGTTCPVSQRAAIDQSFDSAYRLATSADILLVSGSVLAVTGIVLLLVDPRSARDTARNHSALTLKF